MTTPRLHDLISAPFFPVRTLRRVAASPAGRVTTFLTAYVVLQWIRMVPFVLREAPLFAENPRIIGRRIGRQFWLECNADLTFLLGAGVVAYFVILFLRKRRGQAPLLPSQIAAITATAGVAVIFLKMLGTLLAAGGVSEWWLFHHPVNASYVLWDGAAFSVARFAIKCAITYGPSALILLLFANSGASEADEASPKSKGGGAVLIAIFTVFALVVIGQAVFGDHKRLAGPGDTLPVANLPRFDPDGANDIGKAPRVAVHKAHKGKVLVLDFWASWCAPCKREIPHFSDLADKFRDRGLVVLGVNREPRDQATAQRVWRELAPTFESVVDHRAHTRRGFGERLGVESLPTTYIVDRDGVIRHVHIGYTPPERFEAEVSALLSAR